MTTSGWEFWIDVGGTFTDCFGRGPEGTLRRHKLLSSGVTKGRFVASNKQGEFVDPARRGDPPNFWRGYSLRLTDGVGQSSGVATVNDFNAQEGRFTLSPCPAASEAAQAYELFSTEEAPLVAIRYLLELRLDEPIPPVNVRLGTTRGTNALLTRRGAATALVTTRGFGDILHIGYQNRPRLFDLDIRKPTPLFTAVAEIDERLSADGQVLTPLDADGARESLRKLRDAGVESLAICLLHGAMHPRHELALADVARGLGFEHVSVSSQVAPLIKIVSRGDTTVMDAYLTPVLRRYVNSLSLALPGSQLRIMTSSGGLIGAEQFTGKDSILSGPAGGVVGFSRVAQAAGFSRAIGFDMGGTSTDVSRFDGRYELEFETEKAGVRVVAPMLAIETVAAGGGSICRFDGVKLVVGPESAGADPGPACYGRGGPLTITDVNFYLGRILAERFPFPLDRAVVERQLLALVAEVNRQPLASPYTPLTLAEGFVRIANAHMAKAIRSISVAKGCDARDYLLVAFGGAAGQHACAVADELEMRQILCHPDAGLLSAYGIGLADIERHRAAGVYQPLSEDSWHSARRTLLDLAATARQEVLAEGIAQAAIELDYALELRYVGVDASLTIPVSRGSQNEWPTLERLTQDFAGEHRKLYGYLHENRTVELVAARVTARGRSAAPLPRSERVAPRKALSRRSVPCCFAGQTRDAAIFDRGDLTPGDRLTGPAIVCENSSTAVIEPDWQAEVLSQGELLMTRVEAAKPNITSIDSTAADPVLLEIFNQRLTGIAEQMGITLRNTSSSVNVKERLDFSCAIFTASGDLVVNAPHIPVHLGAMGATVRQLIADNPDLRPGDVLVTNDPYRGGSHLPDVTVVTPAHDPASGELLFFTASRAHHAEIGGMSPGSMPPRSRNLAEEGVLIRNFKLVDAGRSRFDELGELLLAGRYPTRDVAANLADVAAAVAANRQGVVELGRLVERVSLGVTQGYMRHIQAAAEFKTRRELAKLPDGVRKFTDHLDDGSPICVTWTNAAERSMIDFSGSGPVLPGNLNANRAITLSAVLYVLRCLVDEDIPLNQGVLAPVEIVLPECLLDPPAADDPAECAAVAGGNVETSQRVVDVLLGALGIAAASQGTMNNLLFGDSTFGYYETICGGSGATPRGNGADAVHTHMTNTRLTDPEVLERRYPVRLVEFSLRRGSGGAGKHRGGDGVVRRIEFLRRLEVSLISQRRGEFFPYGLTGGEPGAAGRNTLVRADGTREELSGVAQFTALPGDILTIETPGGGGWGEPAQH